MGISAFKYNIILNLKNIPGPTVAKKIIVIEADDYGGIRTPSVEAYKKMEEAGVSIDPSRYNLFDTLEDKEDLECLFEILYSVKDINGNPAVFSPFVNVANPDFEKIKAFDYQEYFYEPFTTTYEKYGREGDMMTVWKKGMSEGIFTPEFHGREHLSAEPWLLKLQEGNQHLRTAFDFGFTSVNVPGVHDYAQEFRPEFYFTKDNQKPFLHKSIIEGVQLFKEIFSYTPTAFTPGNGIFHADFEGTLLGTGIKFLNVAHKNPYPAKEGNLLFKQFSFKQGIKNKGLNYYIRNCAFEPTDSNYSSIDLTLQQIAASFRFNKPAIISTHRVNFVGALSVANRYSGLMELQNLLHAIVKRWPDVTFMSTANMLKSLR